MLLKVILCISKSGKRPIMNHCIFITCEKQLAITAFFVMLKLATRKYGEVC